MKKAAEYASTAGDKRTLVLIRFAQASATFFTGTIHFERAHETFHSAMKLLKTLDDKELYTRITPFLIVMHFIRGNFQQALECYEMLQKSTHKPVLPLFESQLVLQAASSAAYSGHFAHALGMIKSAISTAELEGNIMSAQICRQHLGVLYAYMRRENDALEILQTVVSRSTMAANPKLMLRAFAAIALCYSRMGRPKCPITCSPIPCGRPSATLPSPCPTTTSGSSNSRCSMPNMASRPCPASISIPCSARPRSARAP